MARSVWGGSRAGLICLAVALGGAHGALAQTPAPDPAVDPAPGPVEQIEPEAQAVKSNPLEIDEVVVTARQRAESVQDVPVTLQAFGSETLERFGIDQISELATQVPNFTIAQGGAGSGGTLNLRGVGSSPLSAAFDSAVVFNIDGIAISTMRLVQNSFMDLAQIEVLKGPQSLYFGKSASSGVVSIISADPGDEFSAALRASREFEERGWLVGGHVAGPITDELGLRFAFQYKSIDEFWTNSAPNVANPERGETSLDMRLTAKWDPTARFHVSLKSAYSNYKNDGANQNNDVFCVDPNNPQDTYYPPIPGLGQSYASGYDCDPYDGVHPMGDVDPRVGKGLDTLVPFVDSKISLSALRADYEVSEKLTLVSITGYFDLEEQGLDNYTYDQNGFGTGRTENITRSFSQEVRILGAITSSIDLTGGLYFQKRRQEFNTSQVVLGAALLPDTDIGINLGPLAALLGLPPGPIGVGLPLGGPDTDTGNSFDWTKEHATDAYAYSAFFSANARLTDRIEVAGGVRWTYEKKENTLSVPYIHQAFGNPVLMLLLPNVASEGFRSDPIKFDDQNFSPELSVTYAVADNINLFAAYKTGFKSGGIDNSALLTNVSDQTLAGLVFESETAQGFEVGLKSTVLNNRLRFNATAFRYIFENLQQQTLDAATIQFVTFNVGEVLQYGAEFDAYWVTPVEGLFLRAAFAYTNASFHGEFLDNKGRDVDGRQLAQNSKYAGTFGLDYMKPIGQTGLVAGFSGLMAYRSKYNTSYEQDALVQDGFVTFDLNVSVGAADDRWQLALIVQNLTNEIYSLGGGGRPFSDPGDNGVIENVIPDTRPLDEVHIMNRGRTLTLEGKFKF